MEGDSGDLGKVALIDALKPKGGNLETREARG